MKNARWMIALSILALVRPVPAAARAQETKPFVLGEIATVRSKILGEERQLYVYTHPAYGEDESRYPVAYVLDGEWNFRLASGVIDLLSSREAIPWMIVVGIPNGDRMRDLSPSPIKELPASGGAEAFRRFLREEVIPFVEGRYRTEPFRLLVGHSLSGLFAVDTFLSEPSLFQACLAVSPYLIWDGDRYLDSAGRRTVTAPGRQTILAVSLGAEPGLKPSFDRLEKMLAGAAAPGLERHFRVFPGFDHETVYPEAVVNGLLDIFHDWRLPRGAVEAGLDGILKHYSSLTARFGYEIRPVYFVVDMIGSEFLDRGETDEAVRILEYAVGLNPSLPQAYENLGRCYLRKGMTEEAIAQYEKALERAPENADLLKVLEELKKKRGR